MTNRFDRNVNYDWNMDTYVPKEFVPNFAAWDNVLNQFQTEKNTADVLSSKMPNSISHDKNIRDQYSAQNQKAVDDLTELYSTGDVNKARSKQSELMRQLSKDWSPGGKAYQLESRKKQYDTILSDYKKKFKDDPGFMLEYANAAVNSGINPGALEEGIGDPNIGAYVNIGKELDEALKGYKADGQTISKVGGRWIYKESNEQVPERELRKHAQQILSQPRFREQMRAEAWNTKRSIDENSALDSYNQNLDMTQEDYNAMIDGMDTREFQRLALENNLDIGSASADGIEGPATKNARGELKKMFEDQVTEQRGNFNYDEFIGTRLQNQYVEPLVGKYGYSKYSLDLKENPYALEATRQDNRKRNIDAMTTIAAPVGSTAYEGKVSIAKPTDLRKEKEGSLKDLNNVSNIVNTTAKAIHPSLSVNNAHMAVKAATNARQSDGSIDPDVFKSIYGDKPEVNELITKLEDGSNVASLDEAIKEMDNVQTTVDRYEAALNTINYSFNNSAKGKKYWESAYENAKKDKNMVKYMEEHSVTNLNEFSRLVEYEANILGKTKRPRMTDSHYRWKKAVSDYAETLDKEVKDNPEDYKSLAPVILSGKKGTAVDEYQKANKKTFIESGGLAYENIGGGPPTFVDDNGNSFTLSDVDIKSVSLSPAVDFVDEYEEVVVLHKETKKPLRGRVKINREESDAGTHQSAMTMFSETYDDNGEYLGGGSNDSQRRFAATKAYKAKYKPQSHLNARIRSAGSDISFNTYGLDIDTQTYNRTKYANVTGTEVYTETIPENGQKIKVITRQNDAGKDVWHVIQTDSNGQYFSVRQNGMPKTYTSYASAEEQVATMMADADIKLNGVDKYRSKTQRTTNTLSEFQIATDNNEN